MSTKNYKWFNDGINNYRCLPEDSDPKWFSGRLIFWTDETTEKSNLTKSLNILNGKIRKKRINSQKSIDQSILNFKNCAKKRHNEKVAKVVQSEYWNGKYTREQYLNNKDIKYVHDYKVAEHKKNRPESCQKCGKKDVTVLHHIDEKTNNYGCLDIETEWLCRSCHSKAHLESGLQSINKKEKGQRLREKNDKLNLRQQIVCYETKVVYNGISDLIKNNLNGNKIWCCCSDAHKFLKGDLEFKNGIYKGRRKSCGFHWYFKDTWDERLKTYWNESFNRSSHMTGKSRGQYSKKD